MISFAEIKKSFLVSLWFMFLTFPIMVIRVNTVENIVEEHYSRNPRIVGSLFHWGYIEELGLGVDLMIEEMVRAGHPPPKFKDTPYSFTVTLHNVRNFDHGLDGTMTERWETRTYDLDTLVGLDIFISFWGPTLYGHTIASWEFADGRRLAVSIETRKEQGEEYSAVRGFFRQFELYYVVSDESDVVALRTNQRGERVELYRTLAMPAEDRALLLDYVREMNALAEAPRWYNALTHNCTTTIWHHAKAVGSGFPLDWRLLANGYLVDLSYELGTVNTSIGLDELKRRSDITLRARQAGEGVGFSRTIRQGVPSRPSADTQEPAPG